MNFPVNKNFFNETGANDLAFLILDFNRPQESYHCLMSIKKHCKVPHKILFYSNGGEQDYAFDFYKRGLIDILILANKNEGSSIGTIRLTEICPSQYFINLQCDNFLIRDLEAEEIDQMRKHLAINYTKGAIDFIRLGNQVFSERAFFANTAFYLSTTGFTHAGTGPFQSNVLPNSEQAFSAYLKENSIRITHWLKPLIGDSGKYAILETKCGGILKRRCDTQEMKVERVPKEKMPAFNLSDEEWEVILAGKWEDWRIPDRSKEWVFNFYSNKFENPANEIYKRKQ